MHGFDPSDPLAWLALADWLEEQGNGAASLVRAMKLIPPGTFLMGSQVRDERFEHERPQHEVEITRSFYLGAYQVTRAQWYAVMGNNPGYFQGGNLPVETVSWKDCQGFCERLSEIAGTHFRLPTEAEWEYACRAGTTTDYYSGDSAEDLDRVGWYSGNSVGATHPVGQKEPNAWGLYDMHGNVCEWCSDWYYHHYSRHYHRTGPERDPPGPTKGDYRVVRGGGWSLGWPYCRSAARNRFPPDYRHIHVGFRVAADLSEAKTC